MSGDNCVWHFLAAFPYMQGALDGMPTWMAAERAECDEHVHPIHLCISHCVACLLLHAGCLEWYAYLDGC
jgi:hypothetical protein